VRKKLKSLGWVPGLREPPITGLYLCKEHPDGEK
jgi:hypothetical protein